MNLKPDLTRLPGLLTRPKMEATIMLAPFVGAVAGVGAIAFHLLCELVMVHGLHKFAGYNPGAPAGETHLLQIAQRPLVPWLLIVIPAVGGLISGWLVYTFAPEAEGHGTDAAIDGFHNKRGLIRGRIPLIKMLASATTISTGGSGGQEGPIAQIGAGFGSFLASYLKLTDHQRRVLMLAGVGAGIGAIFRSPLAGAIFAIEVLYRDPEFEADALIPAFLATTVAYCVFCLFFGFQTLFAVEAMMFDSPLLLLPLACLALAMVLSSLLYVRIFESIHRLFTRLPGPRMIKPVWGAAATGMVAVAAYYAVAALGPTAQQDVLSVLSSGYGFLQKLLAPQQTTLLLAVLLIVGFGKMLTTALTIGSGGSGGLFAPSMVIGGTLGTVVGLVFHQLFPEMVSSKQVGMFAILGMASFFSAVANTPVSALIMVSEMTGSYSLLLPSMWVCALAYLLKGDWTLFSKQVANRIESPAHRGDFIIDVLEGMQVKQSLAQISRQFLTVPVDMPLRQIAQLITHTQQTCFPVVDQKGNYYGLFGINDVRQFLYDFQLAELAVAQDLAQRVEPLTLSTDLSSAIGQFAQGQFEELPVVDADQPGRVVGLLRRQDIIASYSSQLLLRQDKDASSPPRSVRSQPAGMGQET